MTNKCEYYILEPILTERTPLLMNDSSINPKGTTFLYLHSKVDDDYVAHLQFKMSVKNPDMNVDYLFLETFPVFSKKVYTELQKHMPINSLQLVKAVIMT